MEPDEEASELPSAEVFRELLNSGRPFAIPEGQDEQYDRLAQEAYSLPEKDSSWQPSEAELVAEFARQRRSLEAEFSEGNLYLRSRINGRRVGYAEGEEQSAP